MKLRASVPALILSSLALPAALSWVGLGGSLLAERSAAAQPADAVTEVARQRYGEGVKAFDAGRFEDARSAFLQAYALKRVPAILLNLGQSEVRSGKHWEDAGNHLEQFLRENAAATPDQRASAEKGIEDARKHAGLVVISVDAAGAEVSIDGTSVGKSPIADPVFVKPGKHTLVASLQSHTATVEVDAKVGKDTPAALALGVPGTAAPVPTPVPVPVAPAPVWPATGAPVAPPPGPAAPPMQPQAGPYPPPTQPYPPQGQMGPPGPDQGSSEREPFLQWYTHKPLAWLGTGVAGLGFLGGIIFSASAGAASSTANNHADQIRAHAATDPVTNFGARHPCGPESGSGGDLKGYSAACSALRSDLSQYHTDTALAVTGWVLFGVGAVGTAAYALVDWYPGKKPTTAAAGPHVLAVVPAIGPTQQGATVLGTF